MEYDSGLSLSVGEAPLLYFELVFMCVAGWAGLLGHASSPDTFSALNIYPARVLYLLSSSGSLGTLRWWQWIANPILKDMYLDFPLLRHKP
ncbi:expressed protein [Echinococcus multilocularis]|uniref:Expressed protein n=1 Tax=Echinococcus multilocularis TaxID=6211 RepID=A0A068Y5A0_ECHMU|nr:expressed protein [Echinococcus multilocularis]